MWITDFTYLYCGQGWVYLIAIRDAHSRRVIGYALDTVMTTDVVIRAMKMALETRGSAPEGLVLHADRGSQFTSHQMKDFMDTIGGSMSMGRTGVCWQGAMAESFWATLKVEHYFRYAFATRRELIDSIVEWIEVFYNRKRVHSSLGYLTPMEYELTLEKQKWAKAA